MQYSQELVIQMIPVERVRVLNPRERNRKKYKMIVGNIADIGLKRPITVSPCPDGWFDLVCGQGRLEAYKQLGQEMVPAVIREVSREDAMLMSLVENIARANPRTMDVVRQLAVLREKGYNQAEIGVKVGMGAPQVSELLLLLDHGEERLISAVERGRLPLWAAVIIARSEDKAAQLALAEAFEEGKLSGKDLQRARVIANTRKGFGKEMRSSPHASSGITSESVVRAFKREQERQRDAIRKAELCAKRLAFAAGALRLLCHDESFVNLLRAEGLDTLPQYLAAQVQLGAPNE
jgi:ParB family chromosome partitioning protein